LSTYYRYLRLIIIHYVSIHFLIFIL
jgi:hypothetical protein